MIQNPFTNRSCISSAQDFFGRHDILDTLMSRLLGASKPQCLAVVGQRRIGKSSLFRRALALIDEREEQVATAYYDLEAARKLEAGRFYTHIAKRLARAMDGSFDAAGEDPWDALNDFLEDREQQGWRFVVALDEFDTVTSNPRFDADFFASLRYLVNNFPLAFVTSSYEDLTELCHAEEIKQSPFFNVFTTVDLGLMPRAEAEDMLDVLILRGRLPFTPDERAFVLSLGCTYPFFIQVAGSAVWEEKSKGSRSLLSEAEWRFREEAAPHFTYFVEHLGPSEQEALQQVARGDEPAARPLRRLERRSLVRRQGSAVLLALPALTDFVRQKLHEEESNTTRPWPAGARPSCAAGELVADRFRIERTVGKGGFGTVLLARDEKLGREVALKLLRGDRLWGGNLADTARSRFRREARAAARLNHPNIVTVYDVLDWGEQEVIAMEFVDGSNLHQLVELQGPLPEPVAADIGRDLASALAYAHEEGLLHRDIKPANIMMDARGRVRIMDFGLVKAMLSGSQDDLDSQLLDSSGSLTPIAGEGPCVVGTPSYMSPEQLRGEPVDQRVDIYALGIVLFELASGKRPFSGSSVSSIVQRVLNDPTPDLLDVAPRIDRRFAAIVRKAMARLPGDRYPDGHHMARALGELAG